jgi:hypothetical protein
MERASAELAILRTISCPDASRRWKFWSRSLGSSETTEASSP